MIDTGTNLTFLRERQRIILTIIHGVRSQSYIFQMARYYRKAKLSMHYLHARKIKSLASRNMKFQKAEFTVFLGAGCVQLVMK